MLKTKHKKHQKEGLLPRLSKLDNVRDDYLIREEVFLDDVGFRIAINRASINNVQAKSPNQVAIIHAYKDKLETTKKNLVKRIFTLAKKHMSGIQLEIFLLSFKYGINKCQTSKSLKVSRQSVQIRNRRAIRKMKKILYKDMKTRVLLAEMQRIREKLKDIDE